MILTAWLLYALLLCGACSASISERPDASLPSSKQQKLNSGHLLKEQYTKADLITLYLEDNLELFKKILTGMVDSMWHESHVSEWLEIGGFVRFDKKFQTAFLKVSNDGKYFKDKMALMFKLLADKYPLHYPIVEICMYMLIVTKSVPLQGFITAFKNIWDEYKVPAKPETLEYLYQSFYAEPNFFTLLSQLEYVPVHLFASHLLKGAKRDENVHYQYDNFEWLFKNGQSADILMNLDFPYILSKLDWKRRIPTEIHEHIIKNRALDNSLYRNYAENLDTFPNEKVCLCDFSSSFGLTVLMKNSFFHSWKKCGYRALKMALTILSKFSSHVVDYLKFFVTTPHANVKDVFDFTQLIKKNPYLADIADIIFKDRFTPFFLNKRQSEEEISTFHTLVGIPNHATLKAQLLFQCMNHKNEACYKDIISSEEDAFHFANVGIQFASVEFLDFIFALAHERSQAPMAPIQLYYAAIKGDLTLMPDKIDNIFCSMPQLLMAVQKNHRVFPFILEHCAIFLDKTYQFHLHEMFKAFFSHPQRDVETETSVILQLHDLIGPFIYGINRRSFVKEPLFERVEEENFSSDPQQLVRNIAELYFPINRQSSFYAYFFIKNAQRILSNQHYLSSVLIKLDEQESFETQLAICGATVPSSLHSRFLRECIIYAKTHVNNPKNIELYAKNIKLYETLFIRLLYDDCFTGENIKDVLEVLAAALESTKLPNENVLISSFKEFLRRLDAGREDLNERVMTEIIDSLKTIITSYPLAFKDIIFEGLKNFLQVCENFISIYENDPLLPLEAKVRSFYFTSFFSEKWTNLITNIENPSDSTISLIVRNTEFSSPFFQGILKIKQELAKKYVAEMASSGKCSFELDRLRMIVENNFVASVSNGCLEDYKNADSIAVRNAMFTNDREKLQSLPTEVKRKMIFSYSSRVVTMTQQIRLSETASFETASSFVNLIFAQKIPFIYLKLNIVGYNPQPFVLSDWISSACEVFSLEFFTTTRDQFLIPKMIEFTVENTRKKILYFGFILAFAFAKKFTVQFNLLEPLWKLISNHTDVLSDSDLMLLDPDTFGHILGGELDQLLASNDSNMAKFEFSYNGKILFSEDRTLDSSCIAEFKDKVREGMRNFLSSFFRPISSAFLKHASHLFRSILASDPQFVMKSLNGRVD